MEKIDNYVEVLEILKKELPQCFKRGDEKLPLAVGILESVLKHFENDMRFDSLTLKKAIALYCKGTKYLSAVIEGAPRIDMNGKTVSRVEKIEEEYAFKILSERKARKKNEAAENSQEEVSCC